MSAIDITHGPPKLDDAHVRLLVRLAHRDLRHALDPVLYGASDVRNDLHSYSEVGTPVNSDISPRVKTTRLFFDHLSVDFASCNIVIR